MNVIFIITKLFLYPYFFTLSVIFSYAQEIPTDDLNKLVLVNVVSIFLIYGGYFGPVVVYVQR